MSTATATVVCSSAEKNASTLSASNTPLATSSHAIRGVHCARGSRQHQGKHTTPITKNSNGPVTVGGNPLGRKNRLHVPHDAAAPTTMKEPATLVRPAVADMRAWYPKVSSPYNIIYRRSNVAPGNVTCQWYAATIVSVLGSSEVFIRAFHAAAPGCTSRAMGQGRLSDGRTSYQWLVDDARAGQVVLDLGAGDGASSVALLDCGASPIAVDVSVAELGCAGASPGFARVCARASALPFVDGAFAHAVAHMAVMLFDDIEDVVAQLARVLQPGATFAAIVGGGPPADGPPEAFGCYVDALSEVLAGQPRVALGDRRSKSEAGWQQLFTPATGFRDVRFVRDVLVLDGPVATVWQRLAESYDLPPGDTALRTAVYDAFLQRVMLLGDANGRVPLRWVLWRATTQRM